MLVDSTQDLEAEEQRMRHTLGLDEDDPLDAGDDGPDGNEEEDDEAEDGEADKVEDGGLDTEDGSGRSTEEDSSERDPYYEGRRQNDGSDAVKRLLKHLTRTPSSRALVLHY